MFPCPCCGYDVFAEPPGSYTVCPICFWEDDLVQLAFPDATGGANKCSLIEGQANFATFGACDLRSKSHVRRPSDTDIRHAAWRPIDARRDLHLSWRRQEDHDLWQTMKERTLCLY